MTAVPDNPDRRLFYDGTYRLPIVTVFDGHADKVGIGIKVRLPRINRVVSIEGRRPIVASGTSVEEPPSIPVACGRQEDAIPIGSCHSCSINPVLCRPSPGALFE